MSKTASGLLMSQKQKKTHTHTTNKPPSQNQSKKGHLPPGVFTGQRGVDHLVETAGSKQGSVHRLRSVRRPDDDDVVPPQAADAVHLRQEGREDPRLRRVGRSLRFHFICALFWRHVWRAFRDTCKLDDPCLSITYALVVCGTSYVRSSLRGG